MAHTVVVAADLSITRLGIAAVLARDPQFQVIAESVDGPQAIAACRELQPELLILALRIPRFADLAVTRLLADDHYAPRILLLSENCEAALVHIALDAGCDGVLPATVGDAELCANAHRILAGERVIPELDDQSDLSRIALGPRETVILRKVAHGLPNKTIAQQQGVSVRTVGNHLQNIFRKLGASNRTEAVLRARQEGLLQNE